MPSYLKKVLIIFFVVIITALSLLALSNYLVKERIATYLNEMPEHIKVEYNDISVNVYLGNASLKCLRLIVSGSTSKKAKFDINFEDISIENVSYSELFFNDHIIINTITLHQPNIRYYHDTLTDRKQYFKLLNDSKRRLITVNNLKIKNGKADVVDTDSLLLSTKDINLNLRHVTNKASYNNNLPITFKAFDFKSKAIKFSINAFENLYVDSFKLSNNTVVAKSINLETKHSKTEFSKILKNERDHYSLTADSLILDVYNLGFIQDTIFNINAEEVTLYKPKLHLYRDKLVADSYTYKSMYSKILRDLSYKLDVKTIAIVDGEFLYEEKLNYSGAPAILKFTSLNSTLKNVSNTYSGGDTKTTIETHAIFMENTPITSHLEFDVNNVNDIFLFKTQVGILKASHMNPFMEPNLNIKLKGELLKTYFTIDGNDYASAINLKMNYDDFAIEVLKANSREKNKFLSTIANILVNKNSKKRNNNFSEGNKTGILRDKTKSFFNFIWLSIKAGLIDAMM